MLISSGVMREDSIWLPFLINKIWFKSKNDFCKVSVLIPLCADRWQPHGLQLIQRFTISSKLYIIKPTVFPSHPQPKS